MSTHLPMYVFTSQIPTIVISQAGIEPLTVRLMDGQKTLLETTLYPLAGEIKLYDIGRIYEEYLRNQDEDNLYPYAILELEVGNLTWEDNMIIYCPHHCDIPAEEFISKHFLTTLSAKRVPLDATRDDELLAYLLTSEEGATPRTIEVAAAFRAPDGNIIGLNYSWTNSTRYQFDAEIGSPHEIQELFEHFCQDQSD